MPSAYEKINRYLIVPICKLQNISRYFAKLLYANNTIQRKQMSFINVHISLQGAGRFNPALSVQHVKYNLGVNFYSILFSMSSQPGLSEELSERASTTITMYSVF